MRYSLRLSLSAILALIVAVVLCDPNIFQDIVAELNAENHPLDIQHPPRHCDDFADETPQFPATEEQYDIDHAIMLNFTDGSTDYQQNELLTSPCHSVSWRDVRSLKFRADSLEKHFILYADLKCTHEERLYKGTTGNWCFDVPLEVGSWKVD